MNSIVIFASGSGSNFKSIYECTLNKKIMNSKICLLISNNSKSGAVSFAKENDIDVFILNSTRYPDKEIYCNTLIEKLDSIEPDLIVLAGYMKLIPRLVTDKYNKRIVNIHPGKLPQFGGKGFYGLNVHTAVINSGIKNTAVTIHYVDEKYDNGDIIHEESIPVKGSDTAETLAQRVLSVEHELYPCIINNLLNN